MIVSNFVFEPLRLTPGECSYIIAGERVKEFRPFLWVGDLIFILIESAIIDEVDILLFLSVSMLFVYFL